MTTVIYLDFDLCASPFSFDAEADASDPFAIKKTIAKTYDHKDDPNGQEEDYIKVRDYFQTKLAPFLSEFQSHIIILTANSAHNVRDILNHFGVQIELRIVSTFDAKGVQAGISPNLFGAVVKTIKNEKKEPSKQKTIEQIAKQFRVSKQSILSTERLLARRILELEEDVTKAAYIRSQARPFIFLDDSGSEIRSVQALIDNEGMRGRTLNIPRPGRNVPFEVCGMFGQRALEQFVRGSNWSDSIRQLMNELNTSAHYVQHVPASFHF